MPFDNAITLTPERLRAIGFHDPGRALGDVDLLRAELGEPGFAAMQPVLLAALSMAGDPDMALSNLERFVSALADVPRFASLAAERRDVLRSLVAVFGASRFLSAFLIAGADEGLRLVGDPAYLVPPAGREEMADQLDSLSTGEIDEPGFFRALRLFRKREMLRIGLRDLLGKADLQETVAELSDLAEVCLQKAWERTDGELRKRYGRPVVSAGDGTSEPAGFAVIAMGKLGGRELNFSSDVDLMYVYSADGETEGANSSPEGIANRIANHQYFIKLAEKLSAAIGQKTGDGFVFRVDLRLRPEGQRGPLAQSLNGHEIYYESWGQTWERSALIKARPVAGNRAVGAEFMKRIEPFVYRKYLDFGAIAEIREMKLKINRDVELKGRTHRDVKLGYGGIREIEFVIQALQLMYGGRDRRLREKNALKAMHMLAQKGLITDREHQVLSKAYVFLRTVEHRIQILDDLQTQTIPSGEQDLRTLARRTGYLAPGKEAELLLRDYAEHTRQVRAIYDDLFAYAAEATQEKAAGDVSDRLLDPETPEQEAVALLAGYGFRDPGKAHRNLLLIREGSAFVHQTPRQRRLMAEIFPSLLHELVSSPDPDRALNHLESFLASPGSWEALQSLVKLGASAVKVLIAVFSNSDYLSRLLAGRPSYVQDLLESRRTFSGGTIAAYSRELTEAMEKAPDLTSRLDALRRFKHQEELRIGMEDLSENARVTAVCRNLSKLAEVCLEAALTLSAAETAKRYGVPGASSSGLAVIGAGKLGGRELTYGSDLDVLFVFSETRASAPPGGMTVFEYFSKIAEKAISYLSSLTREGFAFRVDTRLRPTGTKGPLVQSIEAFQAYFAHQADTWERQSMLRARTVAGDRLLGREFCRVMSELISAGVDAASLAGDISGMRRRMEEETGRKRETHYNIKQGTGGLVDIEFIVQYLQLLHGKTHLRVRVPGTFAALRALRREHLLNEETGRALMKAYRFLRLLESRMRIVSNQTTSDLVRDPEKLHDLARRMGYQAGEELLREYEAISREVRTIFNRIVRVA